MLYYEKIEETINIISHGLGLLLSIIATIFLIFASLDHAAPAMLASSIVFGSTLMFQYLSSTLYHGIKSFFFRTIFRKLDHIAIYTLIAGTYTPIFLLKFPSFLKWVLLSLTWFFSCIGSILELTKIPNKRLIRMILSISIGCIGLIVVRKMVLFLDLKILLLILYGGISYVVGSVFYILKRIRYNHAIFHVFVMLGSAFHFFAVLELLQQELFI